MNIPFYAKSEDNKGYIKNMEVIGYHDLNNVMAFQMALHKTEDGKYYLYCGSFKGAGVTILDVTDPTNPISKDYFELCDPKKYKKQSVPKIQIADNLMIAALGGGIPYLHGVKWEDKNISGINIYSIEDPLHPKLLSHWETGYEGGMGVHRFMYNGGPYLYLTSDCPGYIAEILRILDISDPKKTKEVGRFWKPEQFADGQKDGTYPIGHMDEKNWPHLHGPAYVQDGLAYCGDFSGAGVILDMKDVTRPKFLGEIRLTGPFSGKRAGARCHTFLPLKGRGLAVLTNEGDRFMSFNKESFDKKKDPINGGRQPMNNLHMIDVSDPSDPVLIAEFPYPEVPKDFPYPNFNDCGIGCQGPFGPHNVHEPMDKNGLESDPNRVYCCYFHAGMRVYDVSDPYYIKELGYFIPPNPEKPLFDVPKPGPLLGTAEDCIVDDRGNIYMDTFHDGVYILRLLDSEG
ncbi:MAG: hypothetical protein K6G01_10245 [Eubacterium sp.]|nr:hypothetical protein [Eubacterium sp.]